VAQQNGHPPTPTNGHHDHRHPVRYESPIGPDEVYDQEADEAAYNEAMYSSYDDSANGTQEANSDRSSSGNKEHVA